MILWIILFILILAISFVLAVKSMKDYQEIPSQSGGDFSLFLIRNPQNVNEQFFKTLYTDLSAADSNITLERLFKGQESALVIFGSRQILAKYKQGLDLLELEDYTNVNINNSSCWEMRINGKEQDAANQQKVFGNMPELINSEQVWWQVLIWPAKNQINSFHTLLRIAVCSPEQYRRRELTQKIQTLSSQLVKLPKAFSNAQLLGFYKQRSFPKMSKNHILRSIQIWKIVSLL